MSEYSLRFSTPDWIQRARTQVLKLEPWRDNAIVPCSSGKLTIYSSNDTPIVESVDVVVDADGAATYSLNSSVVPITLQLEEGWREVWTLQMPDGEQVFERDAALVRSRLRPVITANDFDRCHDGLRRILADAGVPSLQPCIDEGFDRVLLHLVQRGRYPYLVLNPWALRLVHLYTSLHVLFLHQGLASAGYAKVASDYKEAADKEWPNVKLTYDLTQDGKPTIDKQGVAETPSIMLGGAPGGARRII